MNGIPPNAPIAIPDRSEIESAECAICRENDCNPAPLMTTTTCNHTFHKICLDNWLIAKNTCPMCRVVLSNRAADPIDQVTRHVGSRFHRALDEILMSTMRKTYNRSYERALKNACVRSYGRVLQRACLHPCERTQRRNYVRACQQALRPRLIRSPRQSFDIGHPQSGKPEVNDVNLHNAQGTRLSLPPCTDMLPKKPGQERT